MLKMKKYLPIVIFVVSFVLDAQYGILEKIIVDPFWVNIVKGLGAFLLAYLTEKKLGLIKTETTMTHEVTVAREATEEEAKAIEQANAILSQAGLELVGTRPKDR